MDGSVKQYSSTGIKTLMEASATLPQAIDSLQSSTNCHLSFDCGPGQMISQNDGESEVASSRPFVHRYFS
jgi:hypothetical protein